VIIGHPTPHPRSKQLVDSFRIDVSDDEPTVVNVDTITPIPFRRALSTGEVPVIPSRASWLGCVVRGAWTVRRQVYGAPTHTPTHTHTNMHTTIPPSSPSLPTHPHTQAPTLCTLISD
jgi:hypothetical protein